MHQDPVPQDPGQGEDPPGVPAGPGDWPRLGEPGWTLVPQSPDWPEWMDDPAFADDEEPGDPDEDEDPDNAPPPGLDDAELAALLAEAREITASQTEAAAEWAAAGKAGVVGAVASVVSGRRGPGQPGSAQTYPGEYASRAADFASG